MAVQNEAICYAKSKAGTLHGQEPLCQRVSPYWVTAQPRKVTCRKCLSAMEKLLGYSVNWSKAMALPFPEALERYNQKYKQSVWPSSP